MINPYWCIEFNPRVKLRLGSEVFVEESAAEKPRMVFKWLSESHILAGRNDDKWWYYTPLPDKHIDDIC